MNYHLTDIIKKDERYLTRLFRSIREIAAYLKKSSFLLAVFFAILSSTTSIITPYLLGSAIDKYISKGDLAGLDRLIFILLGIFILSSITMYFQQNIMGKTAQAALYKLRGVIFNKIQSLPIAFFNQNKTGDLMSRINNDTDKLSQFLSESILRFVGSAFTLTGIAIFVVYLNWKLGLVLLSSTVFLLCITRFLSPYLERGNRRRSAVIGEFTAGATEQLANFKAIIAYDRRNFFDSYLKSINQNILKKSITANILGKIFEPIYDFAGYIAQAVVLAYGIVLVGQGEITVGLLIGFLTYTLRFYDPLRFMANIFGDIQVSLASWGRISDILSLSSNIQVEQNEKKTDKPGLIFDDVSFGYEDSSIEKENQRLVLKHVSFELFPGKTYALVGPTGGGKSTIASIISRLYDPTEGIIFWNGKDMKTWSQKNLSKSISVILQEPFMFSGTVAENISYGNEELKDISEEKLKDLIEQRSMLELVQRFSEGLKTKVESGGENISLGQKQIISFLRIVLRAPELLILDEATANIDTVTEATLQNLIDSLPQKTIKVIIAHRLNTIKNADEILFVSGGGVKRVNDEKAVLELLKGGFKS